MHPTSIPLTRAEARRFLLGAHGLQKPFSDIDAAIAHHGYVQIDPINVCGRMHDLILRNRVSGYREGDLMRHLHGAGTSAGDGQGANGEGKLRAGRERKKEKGEGGKTSGTFGSEKRTAFEHHLPHSHVLVAFGHEAWPHLHGAMQTRTRTASAWSGRLTPREKSLVDGLLEEIQARGPLGSADFEDRGKSRAVWGQATLVKSVLQKLFFHGRLLIAARVNNHRKYDLPERILPPPVLAQPPASPEETLRWVALLKVRQHRLALLKRDEVAAAGDAIVPVEIEGCPRLYCLAEDAAALAESKVESPESRAMHQPSLVTRHSSLVIQKPPCVRLLAPLDPMIYQRRVTSALWDFDYTWEVYTPPAKRVRGYYALPVLSGADLVGHVDPKIDRTAGKLVVASKKVRRGHTISRALADLSGFLTLQAARRPAQRHR